MTDFSATHDAAVTDRTVLTRSAYNTEHDLAARQSLYQWQTPRHDLPGLVVRQLQHTRGTVADIGCGNGKFIKRIRQDRPDLSLLGLDVSLGILGGVPGPVAVADAGHLPLRPASIEASLALHMLYHAADIPRAISELSRITTQDGVVVASTNSDRDKAELNHLWEQAAGDVLGIEKGPARISLSARFSLEKAPTLLGEAFTRIETIELPGTIAVREPGPVIAHMASYRAWADQHDVPFEETIERARGILEDHIRRRGAFEITCLGGLLICSR
ncbi:class I SAM-dependent methyltransferase [Streptomyces sp. NBC_01506]|uniref:class I SAM-dependent methyltransferase n=1 Tax=Streptomyces sp. NBC_01506 TaxID=2903887 RepID=UPI00386FDDE9